MGVKSAERALELLALIAREEGRNNVVTQASLRELTGLPRSSLHALLVSLVDSGFVEISEDSYRVGMRAFEVGNVWASGLDVIRVAKPVLSQLVKSYGHTANLGVLDEREVVYLLKVDAPSPIRLVSEQGKRLPAHSTALGKALLSQLEESELEELYRDHELVPVTGRTITEQSELFEQIAEVRATGVATEFGESTPDVRCWASLVRGGSGAVVGAISVSAITLQGESLGAEEIIEAVSRAADEISAGLGFRSGRSLTH